MFDCYEQWLEIFKNVFLLGKGNGIEKNWDRERHVETGRNKVTLIEHLLSFS